MIPRVLFILAVVLAGSAAWSVSVSPAPVVQNVWPVMIDHDPQRGTVTLTRGDFDAIVRTFNDHLYELRVLRLVKGCP